MILKHIYQSKRWPSFRTGCKSKADCLRLFKYLTREEASHKVLRNDFDGDSPEEIADHLAMLHREQDLWGYHVVAAYPPEEEGLWSPQAEKRIGEVQDALRIEKGFWVQHKGHWHGFLMSMKPNGGTIRLGSYDKDGQPVTVARTFRRMAEKWENETPGCRQTGRGEHGLDLHRDALGIASRLYREGKSPTPIPIKMLLKAQVEKIVTLSASFAELHARAAAVDISIAYRRNPEGGIVGVSFSQDGVSLRGRDAGFTYARLQSTYPDTPPAGFGPNTGVAGRIIDPDSRQTGGPAEAGDPGADPSPRRHSNWPGRAVKTAARRLVWPAAQAGFLTRDVSPLLTLLGILTGSFTRICNQNDYRRRQRNHDRDSIPL